MATPQDTPSTVRLLFSETNELMRDFFTESLHQIARGGIAVVSIVSPTIREADLGAWASKNLPLDLIQEADGEGDILSAETQSAPPQSNQSPWWAGNEL